eukprot:Nk52_evm89s1073 gene=Nk52_evmTU89s1073
MIIPNVMTFQAKQEMDWRRPPRLLLLFAIWVVVVVLGKGRGLEVQAQEDLHSKIYVWERLGENGSEKPSPRSEASFHILGRTQNLYLFGGTNTLTDPVILYNDFWELNTNTSSWRKINTTGTAPLHRSWAFSGIVGDKFIVYGGRGQFYYFNDTFFLDLNTFEWKQPSMSNIEKRAYGSYAGSSTIIGNKIYMYGGYDSIGAQRTLHVLDTEAWSWSILEYSCPEQKTGGLQFTMQRTTNWDPWFDTKNQYVVGYLQKMHYFPNDKGTANFLRSAVINGENSTAFITTYIDLLKHWVDNNTQAVTGDLDLWTALIDADDAGRTNTKAYFANQYAQKTALYDLEQNLKAFEGTTYTHPDCDGLWKCLTPKSCVLPPIKPFTKLESDGQNLYLWGGSSLPCNHWELSNSQFSGGTCFNGLDVDEKNMYLFNLTSKVWSLITQSGDDTMYGLANPIPRFAFSGGVSRGEILQFGGGLKDSTGLPIFLNDIYKFNLSTHTWSEITDYKLSPPVPRERTLLASYDRDVYVFGGSTDSFIFNDAYRFFSYITSANLSTFSLVSHEGSPPVIRAGEQIDFKVDLFDTESRHLKHGGSPLIVAGFGRVASLIDYGNGTYKASLTPTKKGFGNIDFNVYGKPIMGSPLTYDIRASTPTSSTSELDFSSFSAKENEEASVVVDFKDEFGNSLSIEDMQALQASGSFSKRLTRSVNSKENSTECSGPVAGICVFAVNQDTQEQLFLNYTLVKNNNGKLELDFISPPAGKWELKITVFGSTVTKSVDGAPAQTTFASASSDGSGISMVVIAGAAAGGAVFIIALGIVAYILYKKKKYEEELKNLAWKLDYDEFDFEAAGVGASMAQMSQASLGSAGGVSEGQKFSGYAKYQNQPVMIKKLRLGDLSLDRELLIICHALSKMRNDNVNRWVGLCFTDEIWIVHDFAAKGSLEDVVNEEKIQLDWMFKYSIATDIAKGLHYIHDSLIKFHGRVKSSNCVIDNKWVVKLTDFGLNHVLEMQEPEEEANVEKEIKSKFWTAPEMITVTGEELVEDYQKGDTYSFGIVFLELLNRAPPYDDFFDPPEEILSNIESGEMKPSFPEDVTDAPEELRELINCCYAFNPSERPSFKEIESSLKTINPHKNANLAENLANMLEKYATNLENIVAERTKELIIEKEKAQELLFSMLPRSVAIDILEDTPIAPRLFDEVTLYFSDIVGFSFIASQSSPFEIVDLLNDLYATFDGILDQHENVYKVETVADSYVVASGLPEPNGSLHIGYICDMALDLMSSVATFRIRHRPSEQLQLRIGIHSGPIVGGVVGLKMPRYCLFGDTINMASRMESGGLALRIHLSTPAHEKLESLDSGYNTECRGVILVKGKGEQTTYWLWGKKGFNKQMPDQARAASLSMHNFK